MFNNNHNLIYKASVYRGTLAALADSSNANHANYIVVNVWQNTKVFSLVLKTTRKCGNYSDVLPLKAARRDSINSEGG